MKPLHICFLCNEYPPGRHGGIGTFTQILARALTSRGHTVRVLGLYETDCLHEENDQGVKVLRIPSSRIRHLGFLENSRRLAEQLQRLSAQRPFDILEGQENAFAFVRRRAAEHRVLRMHGGHRFFYCTLGRKPRPVRSWIESRSFACANRFCAVSKYVAEETRQLLALGNVPIEILPNPVDTNRFRPMPDVLVMRGRIAFVGTLCDKKGIRELARAMPQIIAAVPHAHLFAYGRDSKDPTTGGSYRARLQAELPAAVQERISFVDHVDNSALPGQLAQAEVLVYPSHMEAHPLAWLEGMSMGKPVVASRAGPGPEIIQEGVTGLLCDPHAPESIAKSVIRVFEDSALANHLGKGARQQALEQFSVDRLASKNEEFYFRCLATSPSPHRLGAMTAMMEQVEVS